VSGAGAELVGLFGRLSLVAGKKVNLVEKEMVESAKDEECGAREEERSSGECTYYAARVGMVLLGLGAIFQVVGAIDMLRWNGGFMWFGAYLLGTVRE
jgi:hypothetical protein